jgi:hypothetical protein
MSVVVWLVEAWKVVEGWLVEAWKVVEAWKDDEGGAEAAAMAWAEEGLVGVLGVRGVADDRRRPLLLPLELGPAVAV